MPTWPVIVLQPDVYFNASTANSECRIEWKLTQMVVVRMARYWFDIPAKLYRTPVRDITSLEVRISP